MKIVNSVLTKEKYRDISLDNYAKTLINLMARNTDTILTYEHYRILEYVHSYYQENKIGPLYYNIKKNIGASRKDIEKLFPNGLNSIYTWVGIPIHSTSELCKPIPTISVENDRKVYLDYNATTYPREEVVRFLSEYYGGSLGFGNPSSSTNLGKQAYDLIYTGRTQIADCLKVQPNEIIFVSGGSEANNLAIKGIAFQHLRDKGHIITSKIEHPSVLRVAQYLREIGFDVTYLDVDSKGKVSPKSVKENIRKETILVSIMAANNEIGTINPIAEIGEICFRSGVPFMVDAVQAFGRIRLNPKKMGISLLTISGHKIYGPKGIGAVFVDEKVFLTPLIHGGKQEFGLRAGTENVGSIAAFGRAARLINAEMETENRRLIMLRDFFLSELCKVIPDFIVYGSLVDRLPQNLSIGFPNIDGGALLLSLNQIGVYVSAGAACSSGSKESSYVLKAIGADTDHYGAIRFGFGLKTTKEDLEYVLKYLPLVLDKIKISNKVR